MPTPSPFCRKTFAALAACALLSPLFSAPPAHAIGRLADVEVIDRDNGERLQVYRHQGEHWIAGRPGARYAISLHNRLPGRVLGVVSVDGVNAVSGETAAVYQTGYVLAGRQAYRVTGWRKSDRDVAAFEFAAAPASYAARTGRPDQMGVIGVALFREKAVPRPAPEIAPASPWGSAPLRGRRHSPDAPSPQAKSGPPAESSNRAEASGAAQDAATERMASAPQLGTGHGAREFDRVDHTTFERRRAQPDEVVRIRYDSRENLIAMGIIPQATVPPRPNPFPAGIPPRYVPDPS
ncbi:hypothetical protein LPB72_09465 [Hydrogenophaga crassostreae]|uniref:Uncharacterized protein n=1 Tax=Hydrogenophaga crassostreae TaxID=1763535 RepID=A0A162P7R8_9BURK|nr:hypothetical protein [Hydrogenophaga crassostreae]AOW14095.1 hypothetical protein LPB072_15865 [Hydrogenophaga crassostreae]OAD42184.1 hypothetical protein LPB72_09465 [Hydrogenophaga crassostreae]